MYGAMLGDMIGAPHEFDETFKTKDFPLFDPKYTFTDDTVMTVAVAEALLSVPKDAPVSDIEEACRKSMHRWGNKHRWVGYGDRFGDWLDEGDDAKPYGSYGNGAAMRVTAAGWLYDTIERTREVARATAAVSHNHPEGLKGAEAVAAVIFLARTGAGKKEIREYVEREFGYDLSRSLEEIRPGYLMDETCQGTVPESVIAFLEGTGFEDTIRNVVSLGGDTDTTGAIAGSMAEAFYGVPEELKKECRKRLDPEMIPVLEKFAEVTGIEV